MMGSSHIILFGGDQPGHGFSNDVYVLELEKLVSQQQKITPFYPVPNSNCLRIH